MATDSQILANRRNAQASTGPRTAEGKSSSSGNATKHGLSAGFRVLTNENQQEFDELIAEYHRTFAPTNTDEQFLVEKMAQSRWRLARVRRLEAAVIEQMVGLGDPADCDAVLAAALINNAAGPFLALQRYAAAIERSGYRALHQLLALRRLEAQAARNPVVRNEPNSESPSLASGGDLYPPSLNKNGYAGRNSSRSRLNVTRIASAGRRRIGR
ncbi:MAG: hypothetical protein ABSH47_10960 [Bryobacteraceae bacterium]|jgi:hypothetical protein